MTVFVSSDHHFGHAKVLIYEPGRGARWDDVKDMNDELIELWNEVVGPGDEVLYLGDLALGHRPSMLERLGRELNGSKRIVFGNHDYGWPHGRKKVTKGLLKMYADAGFVPFSDDGSTVVWNRTPPALLSHLPYEADERIGLENRERGHDAHRPEDFGAKLLHGHVHSAWRIRGRQFNVGVDVNDFRPVELEAALAELGS